MRRTTKLGIALCTALAFVLAISPASYAGTTLSAKDMTAVFERTHPVFRVHGGSRSTFFIDTNNDGVFDYDFTIAQDRADNASNVVFAFGAHGSTTPQLVIWVTFERSTTEFTMHDKVKSFKITKATIRLYVLPHASSQYALLETKVFERKALPANQPQPLFNADSLFGTWWAAFFDEVGRINQEIPTIEFEED